MKRKEIVIIGFLALSLPATAAAQSALDTVRSRLVDQGFEVVSEGRTWLGRALIEARNDQYRRELVVNRGSGEVLQDRWSPLEADANGAQPPQSGQTARSDPPTAAAGAPDRGGVQGPGAGAGPGNGAGAAAGNGDGPGGAGPGGGQGPGGAGPGGAPGGGDGPGGGRGG